MDWFFKAYLFAAGCLLAIIAALMIGHSITWHKMKATCIEAASKGYLTENSRRMCLMQGIHVQNAKRQ